MALSSYTRMSDLMVSPCVALKRTSLGIRLLLCNRKVTSLNHENNLSTKSRGSLHMINDPPQTLVKRVALYTEDCLLPFSCSL